MDLNVINLKETFPSIKQKELNAFIKYQTKFSLTLDNLKCINPTCSNNKRWKNGVTGLFNCCSKSCTKESKNIIKNIVISKREITYEQKTGYKNPSQNPEVIKKRGDTYLAKTGYNHNSQNPEIKQKKKETYLKNFGVEHAFCNKDIQLKIKNTLFKKYGAINPSLNKDIILKKKKNFKIKFGFDNTSQKHITNFEHWNDKQFWIETFLTKDNNFDYIKCMDYFNCGQPTVHNKAIELGIEYTKFKGTSRKEQALIPILNKLNIHNVVTNSKNIIGPLELDIYLPDYNLAIEYNGAYWHQDSMKPADYHQSKSIACLSKGIRLLHIFEGYNDYNLEETLKEFLNYKVVEETGIFDLNTGCYPLVSNYKIEEPELINSMGFNIYNAGKIKIMREA